MVTGKIYGALRAPSQLHSERILTWRFDEALDRLVPVSFTRCRASTSGLSTWSSSRGLTPSWGMGDLILRGASRLDAFSAYPGRT